MLVQHEVGVPLASPWSHASPAPVSRVPLPQSDVIVMVTKWPSFVSTRIGLPGYCAAALSVSCPSRPSRTAAASPPVNNPDAGDVALVVNWKRSWWVTGTPLLDPRMVAAPRAGAMTRLQPAPQLTDPASVVLRVPVASAGPVVTDPVIPVTSAWVLLAPPSSCTFRSPLRRVAMSSR